MFSFYVLTYVLFLDNDCIEVHIDYQKKKKTIFTKNGQNKDDAHVSFQDQLWPKIYLENAQFKHGIEFECKRKKN